MLFRSQSQQKIPAAMLNTLQYYYSHIPIISYSLTLKFYYLAAHKHIFILFFTKSFLLEGNLYNFFSGYNLIFLLSLTSISLILPYIIHITNTISHKTSISFTISTLLNRYQTLILKVLLMEGINFYY